MKTKRLNVIDVAKGIGIILVVFAHVNYQPNLLTMIYSFHMPLFFIISGILFDKNKHADFKAFIVRRFKTLFVPYVLFEIFSIGCLYLAERAYAPWQLFDVTKERYLEYFSQILISNWSRTHVNQPLWFIPCLLLVEILYFFIVKMDKKLIIPTCALLACVGWVLESGLLPFDNKTLPWSLDSALIALAFYAIGNLSSEYVQAVIRNVSKKENKNTWCLVFIAVVALVWVPLALMNGKITLGSKILNNGFLLFINGILGTMIILAISIMLQKNKFLTFCGRNSFYLMSTHYIIRNYLIKPIYRIMNGGELYNKESMVETIIPFILVFSLSFIYTIIHVNVKQYLNNRKNSK